MRTLSPLLAALALLISANAFSQTAVLNQTLPPGLSQPVSPVSPMQRVTIRASRSQPHAFDVEVSEGSAVELVNVSIRAGGERWGSYSQIVDPPRSSISFQTASFRFLPSAYEVEVRLDNGTPGLPVRFGPFMNPIQKFIVVDRDAYPQRALLVEGDSWFLFGRLATSAEVSTGLVKHGGTPLGYYHVRGKEIDAYNPKQEWKMPFANWYSPPDYPEGVNGLHQGFEGTQYGIRQSHGCTRVPPWFARVLWDWSEIGVPVVYIGSEYQTAYDRARFDVADYGFYRGLIRDLMLYHQGLRAGSEAPTYFTPEELAVVEKMQPFQSELLEACQAYRRFTRGPAFTKVVEKYATLRGAD